MCRISLESQVVVVFNNNPGTETEHVGQEEKRTMAILPFSSSQCLITASRIPLPAGYASWRGDLQCNKQNSFSKLGYAYV